jgi:hypothetical protein
MQTKYSGFSAHGGVSSARLENGRYLAYCSGESAVCIVQVTGNGIEELEQSINVPGTISALSLATTGELAITGTDSATGINSLYLYTRSQQMYFFSSNSRKMDPGRNINTFKSSICLFLELDGSSAPCRT